jgi:hypothetical protein
MQGGAGPVAAGARAAGGSGAGGTAACGWAFPHRAFPSALRYHQPPSTFALLTNERTCHPLPPNFLTSRPTHPTHHLPPCRVGRQWRVWCVSCARPRYPRGVASCGRPCGLPSSICRASSMTSVSSPPPPMIRRRRRPTSPPPLFTGTHHPPQPHHWGRGVSYLILPFSRTTHHPPPPLLPPARRLWQAFGALSVVGGPRGLAPGAHVRLREPDGVDSIVAPEVAPPPRRWTFCVSCGCVSCVSCVCSVSCVNRWRAGLAGVSRQGAAPSWAGPPAASGSWSGLRPPTPAPAAACSPTRTFCWSRSTPRPSIAPQARGLNDTDFSWLCRVSCVCRTLRCGRGTWTRS